MSLQITRRSVLAVAAGSSTISLAGCSGVLTRASPRDGPDPFYVENHTDKEHRFSVVITRKSDDERIVDGEYRVPADHAAVFADIGEVGTTYRFAVGFDDVSPLTGEWSVSRCPPEERGPDANTAGAFFVREDRTGFARNQCDDQQVGDSDALTYVRATEVAITDDGQ